MARDGSKLFYFHALDPIFLSPQIPSQTTRLLQAGAVFFLFFISDILFYSFWFIDLFGAKRASLCVGRAVSKQQGFGAEFLCGLHLAALGA